MGGSLERTAEEESFLFKCNYCLFNGGTSEKNKDGCIRCRYQAAGTKEPEAEQVEMEDSGQWLMITHERSSLKENEYRGASEQI